MTTVALTGATLHRTLICGPDGEAWINELRSRLLHPIQSRGPAPGGELVATIRYGRRGHYQETVVQGGAQALPRKEAIPAQPAALEKAQEVRKQNEQRRREEEAAEIEREEAEWRAWLEEQAAEGRAALREIVARGNWLNLDTETTGIDEDAEVVEVALVSPTGGVLFESLVRPLRPVSEEARRVHGITDEELAAAPSWPEVYAQLIPFLHGRELVAWNASFDPRVLRRSSTLHGLTLPNLALCDLSALMNAVVRTAPKSAA